MPALMLHLRSPSPGPVPAFHLNCQSSAKRTERSHWSSPSACDGRSFQGLRPGCHLLLLFHPWWSSIRTAKGRVADDRVLALSLDQSLAVFSDKQTAGVTF